MSLGEETHRQVPRRFLSANKVQLFLECLTLSKESKKGEGVTIGIEHSEPKEAHLCLTYGF